MVSLPSRIHLEMNTQCRTRLDEDGASPHLLVVELLGLPGFEELQQVSESSLVVVPEWVARAVPVPIRDKVKTFVETKYSTYNPHY